MVLDLPPALRDLVAALRAAGGRPYVVGGAVRDALLGLPVTDYDLEVFGLPADRLERVLSALGQGGCRGPGRSACTSCPESQASRARWT